MITTVNSIFIKASYESVFDLSNDIDRWSDIFDEYIDSKVLSREGNKITFRLANNNGTSWRSQRLLFKDDNFAYAERVDPLFPFRFMKIIWLYDNCDDGVRMTWIQHFEVDPKSDLTDEKVRDFIHDHSTNNLKRFKNYIEKDS